MPKEERNSKVKKILYALYFMLKGLPFIYQGQELGMENRCFASIDEVDDISSRDEYQVCLEAGLSPAEAMEVVSRYSRDNARTPFQWSGEENGGFTTGKPWLGLNENYREINLEQQRNDPDSLFAFYQKLIGLRKDPEYRDTVVYGKTEPVLEEESGIMAYFRQGEGQRILVAGNFGQEERLIRIDGVDKGSFRLLLSNGGEPVLDERGMVLEGLQVVIGVV